jgi:hypothetical protein
MRIMLCDLRIYGRNLKPATPGVRGYGFGRYTKAVTERTSAFSLTTREAGAHPLPRLSESDEGNFSMPLRLSFHGVR